MERSVCMFVCVCCRIECDCHAVVYVNISYFSLVVTLYKTNKPPPICTTTVRFVDYNKNDDYFDGFGDNDTKNPASI